MKEAIDEEFGPSSDPGKEGAESDVDAHCIDLFKRLRDAITSGDDEAGAGALAEFCMYVDGDTTKKPTGAEGTGKKKSALLIALGK
jgi:hypothetical protein